MVEPTCTRAQFQAMVAQARKLAGQATTEAFEGYVSGVEALLGDRARLRQLSQLRAVPADQETPARPFWRTSSGVPGTANGLDAAVAEFVDGVFAALVTLVTDLAGTPAAAFTVFAESAQAALAAAVRTLVSGARTCAGGPAGRSAR
jgi:hypothetical protein